MIDIQQRYAIAKFCGWKLTKNKIWCNHENLNKKRRFLPKYTSCLNAMHDAEMHLDNNQQVVYSMHLTPEYNSKEYTMEIFASASRRAEAFLKTINKWKTVGE